MTDEAEKKRLEGVISELMSEAGSADTAETRVDCLREAAQIYERRLGDLPRALMAWQTAFAEAPASDDVALAVERVTEALGRWAVVLPDTESLLADVTDREHRTALLTWLARWQARFAHDDDGAEQRLVEAADLSPGSVPVAEALSQLYRGHGEWARAAQVLARTGNTTPDPEDAIGLLLEAARIIHSRVGDAEGASQLYRRILELDPRNIAAAQALTDLAGSELDPVTACVEFRRTLEQEPDNLGVIREWFDIAFANARWDDVRFLFEKVYARADAALAASWAQAATRRDPDTDR